MPAVWQAFNFYRLFVHLAVLLVITTQVNAEEEAAAPANSAAEQWSLQEGTPIFYNGFIELMEDENTLPVEDLEDLETRIGRVALYHTEDRLYKRIPKPTETMIEGMIMKKLLDTGKFQVTDCLECKLIQVQLNDNQLKVSQAIESNQDQRNLARKLKVDGFFMWSANVYDQKFTIDMRLVDATDNTVVWTRQYIRNVTTLDRAMADGGKKEDYDKVTWEMFVGAWGFGSTRQGTGVDDESINSVTTFGIRRRESSDLYKDITYGLAVEGFTNIAQREYFNTWGFILEGRVAVDLPALKQWVPTLTYLELGQAFYNGQQSLLYKYGLEFPFTKDGYIDLGIIYMRRETIDWPAVTGLEDSSSFGGASYDITLGYRF